MFKFEIFVVKETNVSMLSVICQIIFILCANIISTDLECKKFNNNELVEVLVASNHLASCTRNCVLNVCMSRISH